MDPYALIFFIVMVYFYAPRKFSVAVVTDINKIYIYNDTKIQTKTFYMIRIMLDCLRIINGFLYRYKYIFDLNGVYFVVMIIIIIIYCSCCLLTALFDNAE